MKKFKHWDDFTAEDRRDVLDAKAREDALDMCEEFANNVLFRTGVKNVSELEEKYPGVDAVSMRMFLAREETEDDFAKLVAISHAVNLDIDIRFEPDPDVTRFDTIIEELQSDEENFLRKEDR